MTRPALYLAFVLFLAVSAPAHAQQLAPVPPPFAGIDPLESKDLAKAKRAVLQIDVQKLKRTQREAARTEYEERGRQFLAGRERLDAFQDSIARLLESELALHENADEQLACIEGIWLIRFQLEEVNQRRYEAERIPAKDYFEPMYHRLNVEKVMIEARTNWNNQETRVPFYLANSIFLEWSQDFDENSVLDVKEPVKAKRAALRADPKQRLHLMCQLIRRALEPRMSLFRTSLLDDTDFRLKMMGQLRDLGLLLAGQETDRSGPIEEYWMAVNQIDEIEKARYENGRIPIQDFMQSRHCCLNADIALIEAWKKNDPKHASALPLAHYNPKELARKKFLVLRADPGKLRREKLDASRLEFEARFKEFLAGRGLLEILLSAGRLLEDELALAANDSERLAARERHWARMVLIHKVNETRFKEGRIPPEDFELAQGANDSELLAAWDRHQARMVLIHEFIGARFKNGRIPLEDYAQSAFFLAEAEMALKKQMGK